VSEHRIGCWWDAVGCPSIHGSFTPAQHRGKSWIEGDSRLFLWASADGGHTMEDSVLEQAMQALYESDRQIVRLLTLRYQLAAQLAQISLGQGRHVSPEERVSAVVSRLVRRNPGPLDDHRLAAIFAMVIELTEPLSIGFSTKNGAPKKG
jgi:chorismate mutase